MTFFDYCLIAVNLFALFWILFKLYSIANENKDKYIELEAKLKKVEQTFSSEFNNIKSIAAKTSNKLDGVIYKLDSLKKTLSNIEYQISSALTEEQRLIGSVGEKVSYLNSQLSQSVQTIMSKFKTVANSNAALNQLMRDSLDKTNQINYGIDAVTTIQTNNQKILVEKFDKIIKSEELGFKQANASLTSLQEEILKQENLLKPLESLILELTELYVSLEKTIGEIHQEEKSLSTMANKHEALIEAVKKLNQTSVDVFEILKLYILNCSLSPFEKNLTKRSR